MPRRLRLSWRPATHRRQRVRAGRNGQRSPCRRYAAHHVWDLPVSTRPCRWKDLWFRRVVSDRLCGQVLRRYVIWPGDGSALPFSDHNHEPTIAACPNVRDARQVSPAQLRPPRLPPPPCPATHHRRLAQPDGSRAAPAQGDFVANWYSTNCGEEGRCVGLVQSRLKKGAAAWTTAQIQLDAPDRNQCCVSAAGQLPLRLLPPSQRSGCAQTAFYFDRDSGVLYHWSAMSAAGSFQDIMGTLQWSTDCVSRDSPPCCFC